MQRRERILVGVVGLLVGGWILDAIAISPGLAWYAQVRKEAATATAEADDARILTERSRQIMDAWRGRHAAGLLDDEDGARLRAQQAIAGAARTSGCSIDGISGGQLVAATTDQAYDLLRLSVSGQGTLATVQAFIAGLESAACPLRIERCELSARDGRKDELDLALTVSTRIASQAARKGRGVPEGTPAWTPEQRDGALDAAILAARPFLSDRRAPRRDTSTAKPVEAAPRTWALVGIISRTGGSDALLRHLGDNRERIVRLGDDVEGQPVTEISRSAITLGSDDAVRVVAVGYDLAGVAVPIQRPGARPSSPATQTAPAAAPAATTPGAAAPATAPALAPAAAPPPFQVPATSSDPDRDAILERLRQRRNHASGTTP